MQLSDDTLSDDEVNRLLERLGVIAEEAEAFGNPSLTAVVVDHIGAALVWRRPEEALTHLDHALELATLVGADQIVSGIHTDLAQVYAVCGRPLDALLLLEPGLRRDVRAGAWNELVQALTGVLRPLTLLGHHRLAAIVNGCLNRLLEASEVLTRTLIPHQLDSELRAALGNDEFERATAYGRGLTFPDLAALVLVTVDELIGQRPPTP
jgi:hypothetical protein